METPTYLTYAEVLAILREDVEENYASPEEAAFEMNVRPDYLKGVLRGESLFSPTLLDYMELRAERVYRISGWEE